MAKKKKKNSNNKRKKPTGNQQEWKHQLDLLKRRAKDWERKFHAKFDSFPEMPKRVLKKDIQKLKDIKWNKISESRREKLKENYQVQYDEKPVNVAEDEYFNDYDENPEELEDDNYQPDNDYWWNEHVLNSDDEIQAWIDEKMQEIAFEGDVRYEEIGVGDILYNLLENARLRMGNREFKQYLEEHADDLNRLALNARSGSPPKNERFGAYTGMSAEQRNNINEFAQILNLGRPLTPEQSMMLNTEGYVEFDYSEML